MLQVVRQTYEERYEMYMSLPKEKLASMLAESAKIINPDGCIECTPTYHEPVSTNIGSFMD